ncbi:hypothetical protein RXV95_11730 [Novosphingobium sp. ZN18A2]|uniref:helix-turn-helix transcriptional regulator n=1 Tax=Novosphingobium sp. ZN18A2 TaxID=3079861 RepID=UPI0030CCE633
MANFNNRSADAPNQVKPAPDPSSNVLPFNKDTKPPFRQLYTFDWDVIAPYDKDGVVAFVQKEKLENLTTSQVKIFLLVVDGVDDELLTDAFIAEHLDMPLKSVRRHLRVLHKLGYTKLLISVES